MKVSLTIDASNAAFDGAEECTREVRQILELCAEQVDETKFWGDFVFGLRDSNGNSVGQFRIEHED